MSQPVNARMSERGHGPALVVSRRRPLVPSWGWWLSILVALLAGMAVTR